MNGPGQRCHHTCSDALNGTERAGQTVPTNVQFSTSTSPAYIGQVCLPFSAALLWRLPAGLWQQFLLLSAKHPAHRPYHAHCKAHSLMHMTHQPIAICTMLSARGWVQVQRQLRSRDSPILRLCTVQPGSQLQPMPATNTSIGNAAQPGGRSTTPSLVITP